MQQTQTQQRTYNSSSSPWLKYKGLSPNAIGSQKSVSMKPEIGNNNKDLERDLMMNQDKQKEESKDEDDEIEDENDTKERLSTGFSGTFKYFMAIVMGSTMCLLMYSNTRDGAFVQVQVTPKLPSNSNANKQSPLTPFLSELRYTKLTYIQLV